MDDLATLKARASAALSAGDIDGGIGAFRAVHAVDPSSPLGWYNLGYLLRCARRWDEALDAYAQALARGIDRPEEVHLNRAVILSEFRERDAEAEAELHAALAIAPDFATAWLNLGNLHEDRGEPDRAREAYARALAIDPLNGRALARTATIDVFEGQAATAVRRTVEAVTDPRLTAGAAAEIGFALGAALDADGRYDEAFVAFTRANAAAARAATTRYDRAAQEALIDRLTALPPAPDVERPSAEAPIFVLGMFRSGSTLVEHVLGRHSRVTIGGEIDTIPAFAAALQPYPEALSNAPIGELRARYLAETRERHPGATLLTDKRPDNFLHVGLIKRIFPEARIVHTVRNPLDTILSVWFLYFDQSVAYGHVLEDIAHWYAQYRRLMAHWKTLYGDSIHDVSYDALVVDPRPAIAAMLDFCGLDWEDAVLSPQRSGATVRTASVWQVRAPLHQRSSGRWRNYARHLDRVREMLG